MKTSKSQLRKYKKFKTLYFIVALKKGSYSGCTTLPNPAFCLYPFNTKSPCFAAVAPTGRATASSVM
jgi:hypothetical protein